MSEHSPTPWKRTGQVGRRTSITVAQMHVVSSESGEIAYFLHGTDAARSVHCVNTHGELIAMLTEIRKWMDTEIGEWDAKFCAKIDALLSRAALSAARGGNP